MDDDDLRRGRPTAHKKFDEATAILAGDGLLTFAFDVLARPETHPDAAVRIALVTGLARAAGLGGMVGGQMLDLAAEGRFGKNDTPQGEKDVLTLQAMKTGAILKFCCIAGAILGNAPQAKRDAVDRYGQVIGQAFQIADDLLDVEGDTATLGKAAGKDAAHGKATLVDLLGIAGARARLAQLVKDAESALDAVRRRRRDPQRRRAFRRRAARVKRRSDEHQGQAPAYLIRVGMAHKRLFDLRRDRARRDAGRCRASPITRMLIGWDVGVLVYLVAAAVVMARCSIGRADEEQRRGAGRRRLRHPDPHRRRRRSRASARSSPSSRRSSAPIRTTASTSRSPSAPWCCPGPSSTPSSRCTTPTISTATGAHKNGLRFPDDGQPDYWDFVYFSFVVGMTFQVSDVAVTHKSMRRTGRGAWRAVVFLHHRHRRHGREHCGEHHSEIDDPATVGAQLMTATIQIVLFLLAVLVLVAVVAQRLKTAPSILLVVAGIALALIPGLPPVELAPELVLLVLLPPLIYSAGVSMSWREFRFNLRPITLLAFGCVVFTTCAVAAAVHYLLGWQWGVAFVLGAIVAPPDVVAPLAIARRLALPRRAARGARGRRPRQRRHRADPLSLRGRRGHRPARSRCRRPAGTFGLIVVGEIVYGIGVGWLSLRLRQWARQPARRDHAVADDALSRLSGFPSISAAPACWRPSPPGST